MTQTVLGNSDPIVVSTESMADDDVHEIIQSNIDFMNRLLGADIEPEHVSQDGLVSYYVDYFMAQVRNGGFAQFVWNSGWNPNVIALIKAGLERMGVERHVAMFEKMAALVPTEHSELEEFCNKDLFGPNEERDRLNVFNKDFYALKEHEPLAEANAAWIRTRPGLVVIPGDQMDELVAERVRAFENN